MFGFLFFFNLYYFLSFTFINNPLVYFLLSIVPQYDNEEYPTILACSVVYTTKIVFVF